jgi:hypothetical protein
VRAITAAITYLAPGSFVNRRFVAPGVERNTGRYESRDVLIHDARASGEPFDLDTHGFVLARHQSAITDFFDREQVDRDYPGEVVEAVKSLTGATRVAPQGWMVRTSGDLSRHQRQTVGYTHKGGVQPPAGEAHVDFTPACADRLAAAIYRQHFPEGKGYARFIASSLWRAFSEPPQNCPLALCDARSVGRDEGVPNTLFVVDQLPDEQTMLGPMPNEDSAMAASIFHFNPRHKWWYFPNMKRDEIVLLKFHDSDAGRALRTPHTAFHDPTFPDAKPRASIEFRTIAFFE